MAIILMEGFEDDQWDNATYGAAVSRSVTTTNGLIVNAHDYGSRLSVVTTSSTRGARRFRVQGPVVKDWGNIFAFGYRADFRTRNGIEILELRNVTPSRVLLSVTLMGNMVHVNGEPAQNSYEIENGAEYFVEVEVDKVAAQIRLWFSNTMVHAEPLDGIVEDLTYWFGMSTLPDVELSGSLTPNPTVYQYLDDHYALDGNGTTNRNGRIGRVKVVQHLPEADDIVEFDRTGGDSNASQVATYNTTEYVHSNILGASDLYTNSQELPFPGAPVLAVAVTVAGQKEGPDARSVAPLIKSGIVDEVGERVDLKVTSASGGYSVFNTDPNTNEAWSRESAENVKFGHTLVL